MESEFLTTGQAAVVCGVTPDAVLKWIKKGKVEASRTPGGHYRVQRGVLLRLGLCRKGPGCGEKGALGAADAAAAPKRCWEFFGRKGVPSDTCRECLVYRARVEKCYELARLGEKVGHRRWFCKSSCEDCAFYQACNGENVGVLFVTDDDSLTDKLRAEQGVEGITLRFARNGYEGAMTVETFRPGVIVLDGGLPEVRKGGLVESLLRDERLPGVKVFVARRKGTGSVPEGALPIESPFTARKIAQMVLGLLLGPAGDVA